jgi:hypothetical protein
MAPLPIDFLPLFSLWLRDNPGRGAEGFTGELTNGRSGILPFLAPLKLADLRSPLDERPVAEVTRAAWAEPMSFMALKLDSAAPVWDRLKRIPGSTTSPELMIPKVLSITGGFVATPWLAGLADNGSCAWGFGAIVLVFLAADRPFSGLEARGAGCGRSWNICTSLFQSKDPV